LKVADLKEELQARGVDAKGKKSDLAAALLATIQVEEAPKAPSPKAPSPKAAKRTSPKLAAAAAPPPSPPKKAASPKASPKKKAASPKASPKLAPKSSPKQCPAKKTKTTKPPLSTITLNAGKVTGFPEFGEDDHEAAGRWMMCVGPILSQL